MTPLRSIKTALLKTAAFATIIAGLTLPAAHASAAPKPITPAPSAPDAFHWKELALHHATLPTIGALTRRDRGGALPEGVKRVFFLTEDHSVLLQATEAGFARAEGIVKRIDVAPAPVVPSRQVQIKVTFVIVTAADLTASGLHFDRIPMDSPEGMGKPPQKPALAADGRAVAAYMATIIERRPLVFGPTFTTNVGTPANIRGEIGANPTSTHPLGQDRFSLEATPRLNKDGSIALQLRPTEPDEWTTPSSTPGIKLLRTVRNGDALVLVNPFPQVTPPEGANDSNLLVFLTPTVLPDQRPAPAPAGERM